MNLPFQFKPRNSKGRILVVDDVLPMRQVISQLLRGEGYEVEMAADAAEVMQLMALVRWDALVVDIDRPGMNGVELYARILQLYGTSRLPVVFLSFHPNDMLRLGIQSAPWARMLHKPCAFPELAAALRQCFLANAKGLSGWKEA